MPEPLMKNDFIDGHRKLEDGATIGNIYKSIGAALVRSKVIANWGKKACMEMMPDASIKLDSIECPRTLVLGATTERCFTTIADP